jgi:hypothetical protein
MQDLKNWHFPISLLPTMREKNVQEALGEKLSAQLHKFTIDKTDDNAKDDAFSIWGSFDQSVAVARPRGTVTSRAIID